MSHIIIDSSKRTSGDSSNFLVKFKYPFSGGTYRLSLANIPYTIKTIDNRNNTFKINNTVITLSEGDYDIQTILLEVQSKLNSFIDPNFTVSVNNDYHITIQNLSLPFTLDFSSYSLTAETLGFEAKQYSPSSSVSGSYMMNLVANSTFIGIVIKDAEVQPIRGNSSQAFSLVIPVSAESKNSYINYVPRGDFSQDISFTRDVSKLEVSLVDKNEQPINLKGINWYIVLSKV